MQRILFVTGRREAGLQLRVLGGQLADLLVEADRLTVQAVLLSLQLVLRGEHLLELRGLRFQSVDVLL